MRRLFVLFLLLAACPRVSAQAPPYPYPAGRTYHKSSGAYSVTAPYTTQTNVVNWAAGVIIGDGWSFVRGQDSFISSLWQLGASGDWHLVDFKSFDYSLPYNHNQQYTLLHDKPGISPGDYSVHVDSAFYSHPVAGGAVPQDHNVSVGCNVPLGRYYLIERAPTPPHAARTPYASVGTYFYYYFDVYENETCHRISDGGGGAGGGDGDGGDGGGGGGGLTSFCSCIASGVGEQLHDFLDGLLQMLKDAFIPSQSSVTEISTQVKDTFLDWGPFVLIKEMYSLRDAVPVPSADQKWHGSIPVISGVKKQDDNLGGQHARPLVGDPNDPYPSSSFLPYKIEQVGTIDIDYRFWTRNEAWQYIRFGLSMLIYVQFVIAVKKYFTPQQGT